MLRRAARACLARPNPVRWSTGCCPKQAEQLTGFYARVSPGKLEIRFSGETELALEVVP